MTRRLVVRRTRLTDPAQQRLWPDWRHHAFLTDLDGDAVTVDAFHRRHAVVELAIRDLKEGAGLDHVPSGNFHANSAWLQCAVLAHNLIRWTAIFGDVRVDGELTVARTMRTRLIALPGRLVNRSGVQPCAFPTRWPWADTFTTALTRAPSAATRAHLNAPSRSRRAALTPPALTTRTHAPPTRREPHSPTTPPHHRTSRANQLTGQIGGSRLRAPSARGAPVWRPLRMPDREQRPRPNGSHRCSESDCPNAAGNHLAPRVMDRRLDLPVNREDELP